MLKNSGIINLNEGYLRVIKRQAITWTKADLLFIGSSRTSVNYIWIKLLQSLCRIIHIETSLQNGSYRLTYNIRRTLVGNQIVDH